ncbi:MAG: efflux RND transporter permease subunit [Ignavibacteriae bacterium]|nr:efflux RND transporter permease subunit [Ignavibacteriota bacterium]
MWLTRLALKYPISTLMASIAILVLGLVSFFQLPIDMLPDIQIPSVTAITYYSGAGPKDMEQSVTIPIERSVSSTNDVNYIQSATREGLSQVRIYFNWDANTNVGLIDVIQKINRVMNQIPDGVSQPLVLKFDITNMPVISIALSSDMDQRDLYDLAYNIIEPQLEHLPGVAFAQVVGGKIREIQVKLDRNRIEAADLSVQQVIQAIQASNLIMPSGELKTGVFDYSLKTESQFNIVEPMGDIIVKTVNNVPIKVRDVARIEDTYQEQTQIIRTNGEHGVVLRVQKTPGANTVDVVNTVIAALKNLKDVPPSVKTSTAFDQSEYIRSSIDGLLREGALGALLAVVVIIVFLRNSRSTLIIFVAIPLSILVTFIFFRFSGTSLNIMTLGGLALGVGRLVDDSIVELENISRHYTFMKRDNISKLQATLDAAQEVASPIFVSTLTTVIVFLPVIFLTGIAKLLFIPLVITISVALFASFFVSRTVTPLLCYKALSGEREVDPNSKKITDRLQLKTKNILDKLDNLYESALRASLKKKKKVILGIFIFSAGSFILFKFIGTEFFPDADENQFTVNIKMPVGTRIEETEKFVEKIEKLVKENVPETNTIISDLGVPGAKSGSLFGRNAGSHAANVQVSLIPAGERDRSVFEIMNAVRPKIMSLAGAELYLSSGGFLKFLLNFGSSAPIDVMILGYDFETSDSLSKKVFDLVKSVQGTTDVQISRDANLPEVRITVDRVKAGSLGISVSQIANTIATGMSGNIASQFSDPKTGNMYGILVRMSEEYRKNIEDIKKLTVVTSSGQVVPLGGLINVTMTKSPVQIDRKYQQRLVDVTANVYGRDLGSVAEEIKQKLNDLEKPAGFDIQLSGNVEQQSKTFNSLYLAFGLAIVLVYMVMASQFQSLVDPFIIMFSVPLGMVGVVWMLFLTNTTLSVTSFEGIIVMVGIVVSNGILLIDYTNRLRKRGVELHEAVVKGGKTRLRPILMTTLATVLGLIPMAIGIGGESSQAPLAIAVIGGLTASTFLTLIFVPTLYTVFEEKFHRKPIIEDQKELESL